MSVTKGRIQEPVLLRTLSTHLELLQRADRQTQGQNNFNRCSIEMVTRLKWYSKYLAKLGISPTNKQLLLRKSLQVSEMLCLRVP